MLRTDGSNDLLTISDAFDENGLRLRVFTDPIFSYCRPVIMDIEKEQHMVDIVVLNDWLDKIYNV